MQRIETRNQQTIPLNDPVKPEAQVDCHFPAIPPPRHISLATLPDHPCAYLPGRLATDRAVWANFLPADLYQQFMDAGFRRSGKLLYQPACRGCRACLSIRVPVNEFRPDKSQRRCARRNADLIVTHGPPVCTPEKFDLYRKYLTGWHGRSSVGEIDGLESFLYDSPLTTTIEFEYRDAAGRLLAVGICDRCPSVLSSVYVYFDPDQARRGMGTFAALHELSYAAQAGLSHYYLGYWVHRCAAMEYKKNYRPHEVLDTDGIWRRKPDEK
jgi:arginyl-tRNA--protein-N-Asp/Glu arginylyltransferase